MFGRTRRLRLFALAAGGAVAFPAVVLPALATTPTTTNWVATATKAETAVKGATLIGSAPTNLPMSIAVGLNIRNKAILDRVVADRITLSHAVMQKEFAPTPAEDQAVASYLSHEGFRNVQVQPGGLLVTGDGTAAVVERAFNTSVDAYTIAGHSAFANVRPAMVPSSLAPYVSSVLGLQNLVVNTVAPGKAVSAKNGRSATPAPVGNVGTLYGPPQMWTFYDAAFPKAVKAPAKPAPVSTLPIAIFAEGDLTTTIKQLSAMESYYKLAPAAVHVVRIGPKSKDTSGDVEWRIDTENSVGMAGGVKSLTIYDSYEFVDSDSALEFSHFYADGGVPGGPQAASASFGECEYQAYLDGSLVIDDSAFELAAGQGQTVFASSGDQGGFCPYANTNGIGPGGPPGVSYPTSSPYVTSVGGTTLFSNDNYSRNQEIAWYTSGGGPSLFEPAPDWQVGVVPPVNTPCGNQFAITCGRAVPDISMDADGNISPGIYFSGGQPQSQGGTSLASPLALGSWARIDTAHNNRLGFAPPLLYGAFGSTGFHDITLGNSGPYPALPGWDYATGMGSFDINKMIKDIIPPVPVIKGKATFHLHSQNVIDDTNGLPVAGGAFDTMDTAAPTGSAPASHEITSYLAGPNTACAGNTFFPVWVGALHGTLTGTIKVLINTVSSPNAGVEVDLWSNQASEACAGGPTGGGGSEPKPFASKVVTLANGSGTIALTFTLPAKGIPIDGDLMLQVEPTNNGPGATVTPMAARALYDSTGDDSTLSFTCNPVPKTPSC